jgi:hypothetical protein
MTSPDAPIPAGTLCALAGVKVRVYATIWPGVAWDGCYECHVVGDPPNWRTFATRDQLQEIGGGA